MIKTITITKEDAAKASDFTDIINCLLGTALKRTLKLKDVNVDPNYFYIGDFSYKIPKHVVNFIRRAYKFDEDGNSTIHKPIVNRSISFKINIKE